MKKETAIKLFESKQVRTVWSEDDEKWYFSIVDIIEILTGSDRPRKYWSDLKTKLKNEGSELSENIGQLKMPSPDGKYYKTDVADTEQLLRLIQSIPSAQAEPFKMWLAKVGYERIEVRKELTDEWENRGVKKGQGFAILTDEITKAWAGKTVKEYKNLKGLKKENLRDNMTNLELVLNMLAEATTTEISKEKTPQTFEENRTIAKQGGTIAGDTRKAIEEKSGKKIVTAQNAKALNPGSKNKKLK